MRERATSDATGSIRGRVLINSPERKQVAKAIRELLKTGKPQTVKLSEETKRRLREL